MARRLSSSQQTLVRVTFRARKRLRGLYYMPQFRLPIAHLAEKTVLEPELAADLELVPAPSAAGEEAPPPPLYAHVLGPKEGLGARTFDKWAEYYTSDRRYIKDSQRLLKRQLPPAISKSTEKGITEVWGHLERRQAAGKAVDDFHSKYQFIEWGPFKWLNTSSRFLACLSAYNVGSPVISLATPIFIMLVPFIILKLRGRQVSVTDYMRVLRVALRSHALGKLFDIASATLEQRIYIAVSIAFYVFQVYQNVRSCIQFWTNLTTVRRQVRSVRAFLAEWTSRADQFVRSTKRLKSFAPFAQTLREQIANARELHDALPEVRDADNVWMRACNVGYTMKAFYTVHQDLEMRQVLAYALDWCGYVENLRAIQSRMAPDGLQPCKLSKTTTYFKEAFFPAAGSNPVRNSYRLDKHLLVTGPNAAGKTTILKATLLNVLLAQQIGFGFYKKASVAPYDRIHCYINIPDTGGRDSLFQAEARRCRNILAAIEESPAESRHFCVFDELYSGTNPYEAIGSAEAFLRYIGDGPNVSFIMTTHFLELCTRLGTHDRIVNCHMAAECGAQGMRYSYKLEPGVSEVKGGVEVLRELAYPAIVVDEAAKTVASLVL
jgi:hypothetical protein